MLRRIAAVAKGLCLARRCRRGDRATPSGWARPAQRSDVEYENTALDQFGALLAPGDQKRGWIRCSTALRTRPPRRGEGPE